MSDKQTYIACWFPSDKIVNENGARRVAYSFLAANEKQAYAKATLYFMEQFPEADDAEFTLKIYAYADGIPCPDFEIWDDDFLHEYDWNDELGYPEPKTQAKPVEFNKLPKPLRVAVLVKYHTTDITNDQLAGAIELQQGESSSFDSHITDAITKTSGVVEMYPERILEAIDYIREKCPQTKKWPEIKAVLANWLNQHNKERKEASSSLSLVDTARQNAAEEKLRVPSGATAGGGNLTDRGEGYKHDFDSLELEVALGLVARAMDFDIYNPRSAHTNRARDIIKLKERPFPALYSVFRNSPGILDYSRAMIIYAVKTAPENIENTPGKLLEYINKTLTETDHANPDPHIVAVACGITKEGTSNETEQDEKSTNRVLEHESAETNAVEAQHSDDVPAAGTVETAPPVEETGPFYFLMDDGEKVGRANKRPGLEKALADGGTEISQEEYQSRKNGTYQAPQETTEKPAAQPEAKNAPEGVFSNDNPRGDQQPDSPSNEVEKVEVIPQVATNSDAFVLRADELEKELGDSENLSLWKSVMRTNPRYTKDMGDLGFGGTSINAEYMVMRATESFGPAGTGWGWTILEDKMIEGAPLTEKIFEGTKFVGKRTLRDADGSLLFELNHYLRIALWYIKDGEKKTVENFGSTPYRQTTKNGIYCDSEVHKKSLTDAIKKCLSMLGFSADVWLGLYDDAAYKAESVIEFGIKDATEKADDSTRIREELDERFKQNVETMRKAVSQNEVSKIASSLTRTVGIHLKSAKEINDQEYVKYLEGRLRRLEEVKSECLAKLQEKAA